MARKISYKQELTNKKEKIEKAIIKAQEKLSNNSMDKRWFEDYRQLNSLRIDLMTVESRIKNRKKIDKGIDIVSINISNQQINLI